MSIFCVYGLLFLNSSSASCHRLPMPLPQALGLFLSSRHSTVSFPPQPTTRLQQPIIRHEELPSQFPVSSVMISGHRGTSIMLSHTALVTSLRNRCWPDHGRVHSPDEWPPRRSSPAPQPPLWRPTQVVTATLPFIVSSPKNTRQESLKVRYDNTQVKTLHGCFQKDESPDVRSQSFTPRLWPQAYNFLKVLSHLSITLLVRYRSLVVLTILD